MTEFRKPELTQFLNQFDKKKDLGLITGSFDVFHLGHKHALQYAKAKVEKLIVLVNSDESIKIYKGKNRPKQNYATRINNLENFDSELIYVKLDDVIPNDYIKIIKPTKYFISKEWSLNPPEKFELKKINCDLIIHPDLDGFSSTNEIDKNFENKFTENAAIFFDRDGTINEDNGYINSIDDVKIKDVNLEGLKNLSLLNFKNIIITNQSGVSKGLISNEQLKAVNNKIKKIVENNDGRIDQIYFDTGSSETPSKYRKPNNGMLLQAIEEFNIVLRRSWLIGDKDSDIELAKRNHIKSIYINNLQYDYSSSFDYDFKVDNLLEAYYIIKEKQYN